jgi:hypothetical protein
MNAATAAAILFNAAGQMPLGLRGPPPGLMMSQMGQMLMGPGGPQQMGLRPPPQGPPGGGLLGNPGGFLGAQREPLLGFLPGGPMHRMPGDPQGGGLLRPPMFPPGESSTP